MILYVYHSSVYHVNRLLISTGEMGFSIIPKGTSSGEAAEHSMAYINLTLNYHYYKIILDI